MKEWTVVGHWDGGNGFANSANRAAYMAIVEATQRVVYGDHTPEDQISTSDQIYGRHTAMFNTKSIGVCIAGMQGAKENADHPDYGSQYPINEKQWHAFCKVIAAYCIEYDIPVTRDRVLTHAEVQPTLGIKQANKWDITVLPWDATIVGHRAVGDHMRALVSKYMLNSRPELTRLAAGDDLPDNRPTLRHGDKGAAVKLLQQDLHDLRYFPGTIDGHFGDRTRGAVLALQADLGLTTDGVVGPRTWAAINSAEPRPLRKVTEKDLADSGTLADTRRNDRLADVAGLGSAVAVVAEARKTITEAQTALADVQVAAAEAQGLWEVVKPFWPLALVLVAYLVWRGLNQSTRTRRLKDAITGANDAR